MMICTCFRIKPIRIPGPKFTASTQYWGYSVTTGWGFDFYNYTGDLSQNSRPDTLQAAKMYILTDQAYSAIVGSFYQPSNMICAGYAGSAACMVRCQFNTILTIVISGAIAQGFRIVQHSTHAYGICLRDSRKVCRPLQSHCVTSLCSFLRTRDFNAVVWNILQNIHGQNRHDKDFNRYVPESIHGLDKPPKTPEILLSSVLFGPRRGVQGFWLWQWSGYWPELSESSIIPRNHGVNNLYRWKPPKTPEPRTRRNLQFYLYIDDKGRSSVRTCFLSKVISISHHSVILLKGDSGGPLVQLNRRGPVVLIGVTSWVPYTCTTEYPYGWAKVSAVRHWIIDNTDLKRYLKQ